MKKIRIIESKGARALVLMRREDFDWLVNVATDAGRSQAHQVEVVPVGGQLAAMGDESYLLEEQKS